MRHQAGQFGFAARHGRRFDFRVAIGKRSRLSRDYYFFSDEKLQRAKELGATDLINYKTTEDWDKKVLELTEKRGVDTVVEVGGAGTMQKSVNAAKIGGHVAVIGVLAGQRRL